MTCARAAMCSRVVHVFLTQERFPKCSIGIETNCETGYNLIVLNLRHTNLEKEKKEMRGLTSYILKPLTFIGALNWGLIGLFGFNLVTFLFGTATTASSIVYCIIGIAALLWLIVMFVDRPMRGDR